MKEIQGAIFDLDGTLFDSMWVWQGFGERYLQAQGIEPHEGLGDIIHTLSIREAAEYFIKEYHVPKTQQQIVDEINSGIEKAYFTEVQPKPGIRDFLDFLKNNGVKMCVATATDRYQVEAAMKRVDILQYFDRIFTCSEVGIGKQNPKIYLDALDFLKTPQASTWIFEDMLYACKTAKKSNFPVVGVQDAFSLKDEAELRKITDHYSISFVELTRFFAEK